MSISSEILAIANNVDLAYQKINDKGGTIPANKNLQNLASAIDSISTGGGGTDGYLIEVIDFRGNVYYSQRHQTGDVVELPSANDMALAGMVFQEFSAPVQITDNKITVEDFDLTIGGIYTTASGKTEIDIELTTATGLSVTLNINGNKDWGDGSAEDTLTSHTYAQAGKYTIKCDGTTITSSTSSGLFSQQGTSNSNYYVKEVRMGSGVALKTYSFAYCMNLKYISLCSFASSISQLCNYCRSLEYLIIPNFTGEISGYLCQYCVSLKEIIMPKTITGVWDYAFSYTYKLNKIVFGDNVKFMTYAIYYSNVKQVILGKSMTIFPSNSISSPNSECVSYAYCLEKIVIPSSVVRLQQVLRYNDNLKEVVILGNVSAITGYFAGGNYTCIKYDFRNCLQVPSLKSGAFSGINKLCKIIVPDSLYTSWIAETNWSNFADYIVKASQYVE